MAKRYFNASSQWKPMEQGLFSMRKWKSDTHKSWCIPAEGFKGHVATDGSLLGKAGKWRACGWSVVQGSRIRRPAHHQEGGADGLPLPSQKSDWTIRVHVDNKGNTDGLWRGERKCIDPKAGDADLWIKLWEAPL